MLWIPEVTDRGAKDYQGFAAGRDGGFVFRLELGSSADGEPKQDGERHSVDHEPRSHMPNRPNNWKNEAMNSSASSGRFRHLLCYHSGNLLKPTGKALVAGRKTTVPQII
jgi:hypothetical protein